MTQVTGQWAHPRTRSPQSFTRYISDSIKAIEPWLEVPSAKPCADPGIFARVGGGGGGGGGVGGGGGGPTV